MNSLEISPEKTEQPSGGKEHHERNVLAQAYACGIEDNPEWCVSEISPTGEERVLHWIRPSIEAEFVAMRVARLVTALGGSAAAKKTNTTPIRE